MQIQISATLKMGHLLQGADAWPMDVMLRGGGGTKAFLFRVAKAGDKAVDAGQMIKGMLGEKDLKLSCQVNDAGIFYISGQTQAMANALVSEYNAEVGEEIGHLMDKEDFLKGESLISENCICMWLAAELGNFSILDNLCCVGYSKEQSLILLACFCENKEKQKLYGFYARLPEIALVDLLVFNDVKLRYEKREKGEIFVLNGELTLLLNGFKKLFGAEGEQESEGRELTFEGNLKVLEDGYTAELCCRNEDGGLKLFSDREDFSFQDIKLTVESGSQKGGAKKTDYHLSGTVNIANISAQGMIRFAGGKITDAEICILSDFSLAALWNGLFADCPWDGELVDVKCKKDSAFRYHPQKVSTVGESFTYDKEIQVYAELTLLRTFGLEGVMQMSGKGLRASLQPADAIDLGFLRIQGEQGKGPKLSLTYLKGGGKDDKRISVSGSIYFFNEFITAGEITCRGGEYGTQISVGLKLPDIFQNIIADSITVHYAEKKGFWIDSMLPEEGLENDALDFLKTLKSLTEANGGKCGAIDFDRDSKKVRLKFKPELDAKVDTGGEQGSWSGTFCLKSVTITVFYDSGKTLLKETLEMEEADAVRIDQDTQLSQMPSQLLGVLLKFLERLIDVIFSEDYYEVLEILLLYLFEDQLEKYAKQFLCRKMINQEQFDKLCKAGGGSGAGANTQAAVIVSMTGVGVAIAVGVALAVKKIVEKPGTPEAEVEIELADLEEDGVQEVAQRVARAAAGIEAREVVEAVEMAEAVADAAGTIVEAGRMAAEAAPGSGKAQDAKTKFLGAAAIIAGFSAALRLIMAFRCGETYKMLPADQYSGGINVEVEPGDSGYVEGTKLSCPEFTGRVSGAELTLSIKEVCGADGYKIDLMWSRSTDGSDRKDRFFEYKLTDKPERISMLTVPVYGRVYLAVQALHKDPGLSSDWSELNYLTEITALDLARWAKIEKYCIRSCYAILRDHGVDLEEADAVKTVLEVYSAQTGSGQEEEEGGTAALRKLARQSIAMLEGYYDEVRNMPNSAVVMRMSGQDARAWKEIYYPKLVQGGYIRDGAFFQKPLVNQNYGIGADAEFTKYEYVQYLWQAYKFVVVDFKANAAMEYLKELIDMVEPYAERFENQLTETERTIDFDGADMKKWKEEYYPYFSKSGLILDGGFFGDVDRNARYGIGNDGRFYGQELCHFLYRLYKFADESSRGFK